MFDFDGTLVQSNAPKRDAFFELFPDQSQQHPVVNQALREYGEESRYVILERILAGLGENRDGGVQAKVEKLAHRYNELALQAVSACPEMPGASEALAQLANHYTLYLSSGTPVAPLKTLVAGRGWQEHFKDIFGYPDRKTESLKRIAAQETCDPAAMLVVGDGSSDRESAAYLGCRFFYVEDRTALARLLKVMA